MFFLALATDYDGTIADRGAVSEATLDALRCLKQSGRRLLLVTGRALVDLERTFPHLKLFDRVIAENGAVVHNPSSGNLTALSVPPPVEFVARLKARNVFPISVGQCIVATWEPHHTTVLETIRELGLELEIIFNKGAVMVLPAGITKASGLRVALAELGISAANTVGVGDAENDHAFLRACGCAAVVANALPGLKNEADVILSAHHGEGVAELVHTVMRDEHRLMLSAKLGLPIGIDREEKEVRLSPDQSILLVGRSACGKSKFAKMLTEKMAEKELEFCVLDPEGDYQGLDHAIVIAEPPTATRCEEAVALLGKAGVNVVINVVALDPAGRKRLVTELVRPISDLKARTGRPHWIIVDEAHQAFPAGHGSSLPAIFPASVFITLAPECLAGDVHERVEAVIAFDRGAAEHLARTCKIPGFAAPPQHMEIRPDEAFVWFRGGKQAFPVKVAALRQFHRRHSGKYAVGDVGREHSFYFRGPGNKEGPCARNVCEFAHLGRQLDDDTWEYHLRRNDYSAWFRHVIRDEKLADETREMEDDRSLSLSESRAKITDSVLSRYAAPLP